MIRPCQQPPFRTKLRWKASGLEWQHGNIRYTFFCLSFLAGVALRHMLLLLKHAYIVSNMMQTMHVVSEFCYSILTVLIKTKYGMFFHFVLGSFSIGERSQRISEACCRRQAGPGVATLKIGRAHV